MYPGDQSVWRPGGFVSESDKQSHGRWFPSTAVEKLLTLLAGVLTLLTAYFGYQTARLQNQVNDLSPPSTVASLTTLPTVASEPSTTVRNGKTRGSTSEIRFRKPLRLASDQYFDFDNWKTEQTATEADVIVHGDLLTQNADVTLAPTDEGSPFVKETCDQATARSNWAPLKNRGDIICVYTSEGRTVALKYRTQDPEYYLLFDAIVWEKS
jgi:hypothetical protein